MEKKVLEDLKPLLRALIQKDFVGYITQDIFGNLIITIPGIASLYDKVGQHPVE